MRSYILVRLGGRHHATKIGRPVLLRGCLFFTW
jgi:hypothetical protein